MTDDARPRVLSITSVTAVSTIDGGDTLAAEVSGPDGGTVFLLIPLGAAGALRQAGRRGVRRGGASPPHGP